MDDVERIRHRLCRVIDVALQVDERRALLEHAVLVAFVDIFCDVFHVRMAFADVHVVTDTDDVSHE